MQIMSICFEFFYWGVNFGNVDNFTGCIFLAILQKERRK